MKETIMQRITGFRNKGPCNTQNDKLKHFIIYLSYRNTTKIIPNKMYYLKWSIELLNHKFQTRITIMLYLSNIFNNN